MAFKKSFVLNDHSINTYGFWIRTAGIKLDNAKKNCPLYFMHEWWKIPIGHVENLRVEGEQLLCDIVIEGKSEEEKTFIRKIENGDIKAVSGGFDPITWSDEGLYLKDGQTRPTLLECELFEVSLAPIPGNKNALALKSKEGLLMLSDANQDTLLPTLKPHENMKQIALKLGLSENATEAEITAAIIKLQAENANAVAMRQHIEQGAAAQLDSEEKKTLFVQLCKSDFPAALSFLTVNKMAEPAADTTEETPANAGGKAQPVKKDVSLSQMIQKGKQGKGANAGADADDETFDYLQKKKPLELARIRKEEPDRYVQLAKEYQNGVRYQGK